MDTIRHHVGNPTNPDEVCRTIHIDKTGNSLLRAVLQGRLPRVTVYDEKTDELVTLGRGRTADGNWAIVLISPN